MPKNYYIILGIPANSTQSEIKAAYRRLAKEFHPDHYGTNQSPFQAIQEAYDVLGNPQHRKSYDTTLQTHIRHPQPSNKKPPQHRNVNIEPLIPNEDTMFEPASLDRSARYRWNSFDSYFDQHLGNFVEHRHNPSELNDNLVVEITLSAIQAQSGGNVRLNIPVQLHCPSCSGYHGAVFYSCWRCNGAGFLEGNKTVLLNYPAGITDNQTLRFDIGGLGDTKRYLTAVFKIFW